MTGVQKDVSCPQCHFDQASYEYQMRDGTWFIFCRRCGYEKHSICLKDRRRTKEIGKRFFKKTKDGNLIYRVYEHKGYGAFSIENEKGVTSFRRFTCNGEKRDKLVEKLKALQRDDLNVHITFADGEKITDV
jgi:hypothetical protein